MGENDYMETSDKLTAPTRDMHRALSSLSERLLGLDRNNQRIDACTDSSLLSILSASQDIEKQHIAMLLEWIRRHDPKFDSVMRASLFKAGPVAEE